MKRKEFSKRVKLEAFERAEGRCEGEIILPNGETTRCPAKLRTGQIEYHHEREATMGGSGGLGNCRVLCSYCHRLLTRSRAPVIAKSNRQRNKHLGIAKSSRNPLPCGKKSRWKKKITGEIVER